jgi:hypothetical protein
VVNRHFDYNTKFPPKEKKKKKKKKQKKEKSNNLELLFFLLLCFAAGQKSAVGGCLHRGVLREQNGVFFSCACFGDLEDRASVEGSNGGGYGYVDRSSYQISFLLLLCYFFFPCLHFLFFWTFFFRFS